MGRKLPWKGPAIRCAVAGWLLGGVVALACGSPTTFACDDEGDCGGARCQDGFCSFPNDDCPSGWQYGLADGPQGTCVPGGDTATEGTTQTLSTSTTSDASGEDTMDSESASTTVAPGTTDGTTSTPVSATGSSTSGQASTSSTSGATTTGRPIVRVTEGLLVLYPFDEGDGAVVTDQSGVGEPFDLEIQSAGYQWVADGLQLDAGIIVSTQTPTKIYDGAQATNELTLEAWVTPASAIQNGPARVVTYSVDTSNRNFTLGQGTTGEPEGESGWTGRVRTTETTLNGIPDLLAGDAPSPTEPTHLAFTRAADGLQVLYVDGVVVAEQTVTGTFGNWTLDPTYAVALGNELTLDRQWTGTFHLVAVYEQALTSAQVQQNLDAGY